MTPEVRQAVELASNRAVERMRDEMDQVVQKSVRATLISLGVEFDEPIDMQKDMQYLRSLRVSTDSIKAKATLVMVGILVTGLVGALWIGIKELLHR